MFCSAADLGAYLDCGFCDYPASMSSMFLHFYLKISIFILPKSSSKISALFSSFPKLTPDGYSYWLIFSVKKKACSSSYFGASSIWFYSGIYSSGLFSIMPWNKSFSSCLITICCWGPAVIINGCCCVWGLLLFAIPLFRYDGALRVSLTSWPPLDMIMFSKSW